MTEPAQTEPAQTEPAEREPAEDRTPRRPTVLLLGTGDPGGELALAFRRLGAAVALVERCGSGPAVVALIAAHAPSHVVATTAEVPAEVLIAAAEHDGVEALPSPRAIRMSLDREGLRRLAADEIGLPTVPFWFAGSVEELGAVAGHAGFPLTVSPAAGTDADRRSVLLRPADVEPAWRAAGSTRVMAESVVDVDDQVTLLTVRTIGPTGPAVHFCEPIGHRVHPHGALESWQPHAMSAAALDAARSIAARIVNSLGGRGVFGVELALRGDEVYFTGVHPGPGDAGLVTLRSQRLSQFELHARAVLGLPLDTISISPAAAELGTASPGGGARVLAEALVIPETDVHFVDGRLLALATAPDVVRARDRAHRVAVALGGSAP